MTTFVDAVINQETRTENGMVARQSTASACVDLFFKAGAMRGKNIIPAFAAAMVENRDWSLRIAQWVRDARGGAGERDLFRQMLKHLENHDMYAAQALLPKIPALGRWDDLLQFRSHELQEMAFAFIADALDSGNGLCAKWMPRKGPLAVELRNYMKLTPKQYRKMLVNLTKVVETQMCAKDWDNINFSHVPSLAAARYKKAFNRNTSKYAEYVASLVKGEAGVKVNAGAVYPYDVLKGVANLSWGMEYEKTELDLIVKQWEALENFVGDASILPMVDVSASMNCAAGGNASVSCMDVAVSLGLYLADKNKGKFKDTFLTFSGSPELLHLKGNVIEKCTQMVKSKWDMNTNLHAAFDKVLSVATKGNVPQEEMPKMVLILSDMQFDRCVKFDDSAIQMINRKYEAVGYSAPRVVFWNLNAYDNVPVSFNEQGVALISGFSPAIMKSVLSGDKDNFTPEAIMLQTIMNPKYDL